MYLMFAIQGATTYAFDLAQVAAVSEPVQCWPIPMAPACYTGAANVHGTITAVMDLALFLGLSGSVEPAKMIVLSPKIAALAFLVEQVIKVVPEHKVRFHDAPADRFTSALLRYGDNQALLLDVTEILRAAESLLLR